MENLLYIPIAIIEDIVNLGFNIIINYILKVKKYLAFFIADIILVALTSSIYFVYNYGLVIFVVQLGVYFLKHYYRTKEMNTIFIAKAVLLAFSFAMMCMLVATSLLSLGVLVVMKLVFALFASCMLEFQLP